MREVEFRDGVRLVPDHLADLMERIDTYKFTYEEARAKTNESLLTDRLNSLADKIIRDHFTKVGR